MAKHLSHEITVLSRDKSLFAANIVALYCVAYFDVYGLMWMYFQFYRFHDIVQYRKVMNYCITLIHIAIYFSISDKHRRKN